MRKVEMKEFVNDFNYLKENKMTGYNICDRTYILTGVETHFKNNNADIEVLHTQHMGGCIINFTGDVCVYNFQDDFNDFGQTFMCKLKNYLMGKGLNCKIAENDLLVDGYKCGSYMSRNIDGVIYTAIHISINMDVDLIKSICTKPMVKIPKGLSEFGITTDEIKEFIIKTLGE